MTEVEMRQRGIFGASWQKVAKENEKWVISSFFIIGFLSVFVVSIDNYVILSNVRFFYQCKALRFEEIAGRQGWYIVLLALQKVFFLLVYLYFNPSSAEANKFFECVWPFVGLVLKGLKAWTYEESMTQMLFYYMAISNTNV